MGIRRQARECALQMLYQLDASGGEPRDVMTRFWQTAEVDPEARPFADELVQGVVEHLAAIDEVVAAHSQHWKLSRMASVDKNILRLAVFELTRRSDIPLKVTINEAVEIAKRFGTAESGAFVNGILDNVAKEAAPEEKA